MIGKCRDLKSKRRAGGTLSRNGKVIVTYSAIRYRLRYCMGMLWADENSDLLDIKSWHKSDKPVFKTSEENKAVRTGT